MKRGEREAQPRHLAVLVGDLPAAGNATGARKIGAGEDLDHARHSLGIPGVDLADLAMRHLAADELGIELPANVDVVSVAALSGQEPHIFAPLGAGADTAVFRHGVLP